MYKLYLVVSLKNLLLCHFWVTFRCSPSRTFKNSKLVSGWQRQGEEHGNLHQKKTSQPSIQMDRKNEPMARVVPLAGHAEAVGLIIGYLTGPPKACLHCFSAKPRSAAEKHSLLDHSCSKAKLFHFSCQFPGCSCGRDNYWGTAEVKSVPIFPSLMVGI